MTETSSVEHDVYKAGGSSSQVSNSLLGFGLRSILAALDSSGAGFKGHGVGVNPVQGSSRPGVHSWEIGFSATNSIRHNTDEFVVLSRGGSTVAIGTTRDKGAA